MAKLMVRGGRVVDPKNGLDAVADLVFEDGRIAEVGRELSPPKGAQVIDATGYVVMPGLVDSHTHVGGHDWPGHAMMARVGVTTALNLSGEVGDVMDGIQAMGAGLTIASLDSPVPGRELSGPTPTSTEIGHVLDSSLDNGAIGVKVLGGHYPYTPDATAEIFRAARERTAYAAFHCGSTEAGSNLHGLRESAKLADGGPLHVAHVNSYCRGMVLDAIDEAREAIDLLVANPNLRSESYLARLNGTSARCVDGVPASGTARNCLIMGGYEVSENGLEQAMLDGFCLVLDASADENTLLTGEAARDLYREMGTNVGISFPVNDPTSQFILATARRPDSRFAVDALSTDGGGIPRNLTIDHGLAIVALGGLSLSTFVQKACLTPARMIGLERKGHLSVGADADCAIVDLARRTVKTTIAGGKPICVDGVVLGSGGTVVTTARGERAVRRTGLPVEVIDLARSGFYAPELLAAV
ncbi:MAG: amidohydrolase family protein [Chloroflexota bacterium]